MTPPAAYAFLPDIAHRRKLGVDHRDPTADRRVLEFCLSIPTEQFATGARDRRLVREGLSEYLPEVVRTRQDRGDQQPGWRARLATAQPHLLNRIEELEGSDTARRVLDLARIRTLAGSPAASLPPDARVTCYGVVLGGVSLGTSILELERFLTRRPHHQHA